MPNAPKYSIVVPAYNAAGMLERLLASFERLEGRDDAEFLIVDDCSTDNTAAIAEAWVAKGLSFAARCLRLEKNSGPGAARNAGLEAARGEYIAFTDTDCVVEPDWLIALVRALDPGRNIMAVGGKVLPLSRKSIFARYNTVNETLEPFHAYKSPPSYVVTCNCCYVRAALLESGGFPVDVRVPGGEDVGASIRMHHRGYRCAYVTPKAVLYHDYRENRSASSSARGATTAMAAPTRHTPYSRATS
jgi:glycosyltransferase involved in cell wall biosynthesis